MIWHSSSQIRYDEIKLWQPAVGPGVDRAELGLDWELEQVAEELLASAEAVVLGQAVLELMRLADLV